MILKTIQEKITNTILNRRVSNLYSSRFKKYGPVPSSVLWFTEERQLKRFEIIANSFLKTGFTRSDTLVDFGCGYGAFLGFLLKNKSLLPAHYYGIDLSAEMIRFCQSKYKSKRVSFFKKSYLDFDVGFSVISGAFGQAATSDVVRWENYVFSNLSTIWSYTKKAMIFNLQYSNSDTSKISQDKIYYIGDERLSLFLKKLKEVPSLIHHQALPNDITVLLRRN